VTTEIRVSIRVKIRARAKATARIKAKNHNTNTTVNTQNMKIIICQNSLKITLRSNYISLSPHL
jgi:hypothetical protein